MDWQTVINWGAGFAVSVASFLAQRAVSKHDKLADEFVGFRIHVANEYVKHTELTEIKAALQRIEDRLYVAAGK